MNSSTKATPTPITDQSIINSYNRGPITTAFEPPVWCSETLTRLTTGWTNLYFGRWGDKFDTSCYPTGSRSGSDLVTGEWDLYFYSPAVCPFGWSTVTTFPSTVPGYNRSEIVTIGSETTAALCCPSGYSYLNYGHQCNSTITQGQPIVFYQPTLNGKNWILGTPTTDSFISGTSAVGDGVPIWWQSSDANALASASAMMPTNEASTGTTPTLSTASLTATSQPTQASSSSGLSNDAKIAIGVSIPVAVIAGLVIGFFLGFRRRRRNRLREGIVEHEGTVPQEKDASVAPPNGIGQIHEVDGLPGRQELPDVAHR